MRMIVLVLLALVGMSLTSTDADAGVHGARTTDGAFQTAATPRKSNASLRCGASGEDADLIHSPGRPTGPPLRAGIPPTRPGAIGAPIRPISPPQ